MKKHPGLILASILIGAWLIIVGANLMINMPILGGNATQSYIDFVTPTGKVRLGVEGDRLFVEIDEQKTYLTDVNRNVTTPQVATDVLIESTAASGITIDGLLIKDGVAGKVVAVTANVDTITVTANRTILTGANQFVTVTSSAATKTVYLPQASTIPLGTIIRGFVNATGFELRTYPSDMATVEINDKTDTVEAAIPAVTLFKVELATATEWFLTAVDSLGKVVTAIVPDAQ